MAARRSNSSAVDTQAARAYPLEHTAGVLNRKLGLYLSAEQQRGFAVGMLIGTALGAGLLAWNVATMVRRRI